MVAYMNIQVSQGKPSDGWCRRGQTCRGPRVFLQDVGLLFSRTFFRLLWKDLGFRVRAQREGTFEFTDDFSATGLIVLDCV